MFSERYHPVSSHFRMPARLTSLDSDVSAAFVPGTRRGYWATNSGVIFLEQLHSRFLCEWWWWWWWCRGCLHQSVLRLSAETGGGGGAQHITESLGTALMHPPARQQCAIQSAVFQSFVLERQMVSPLIRMMHRLVPGERLRPRNEMLTDSKQPFQAEKKTSRRVCLDFIIWGQAYTAFMWSQNQTLTINPRQSAAPKRSLSELMPDVVPAWSNKSRLRALSWRLIVLIWVSMETASCRRPRAHNTFYYSLIFQNIYSVNFSFAKV